MLEDYIVNKTMENTIQRQNEEITELLNELHDFKELAAFRKEEIDRLKEDVNELHKIIKYRDDNIRELHWIIEKLKAKVQILP